MNHFFAFSFLVFLSDLSHGMFNFSDPPQIFESKYFVTGILYLPYAEIQEPFRAFYNAGSQKSRVDYYGDLVKTYQRADQGVYGVSYKIVYVPDSWTKEPVRTCFMVIGTFWNKIQVQHILPDLTDFSFTRIESCPSTSNSNQRTVVEEDCERWDMKTYEDDGETVRKESMWIQRDQLQKPIPIYFLMSTYSTLLGSERDKVMFRYDIYDTTAFSETVFDIDIEMTCHGFSEPGVNHVGEHNPMKEFVENHDDHVHAAFDEFKTKHGKKYLHEKEHTYRKSVFTQNLRYINSKNRAGHTFQLKVNHLADRNTEEMRMLRGKRVTRGYNGGQTFLKESYTDDIPDNFDWRTMGAVTPVKNQAQCGSCWSFGVTGTIEGAYFLKTGKLVRLSQQQLIDCSWNDLNNGCDGGEDFRAYQYIQKVGGISSEEDYGHYLGQDGRCHEREVNKTTSILGYVNVTSGDMEALKLAIYNNGPVSVAIDAKLKSFQFYSSGVYYDPDCGSMSWDLNHIVLAVGYGTLNGQDYWLVKNSWSTHWGMDGYVLISQKDNHCGVVTEPTFVFL